MVTKSLQSFDTKFSADSIECLSGDKSIVACGTYQLQEEQNGPINKRLGYIYAFTEDEEGKLQLQSRIDTKAVLDMKWSTEGLLVAACAESQLNFMKWDYSKNQLELNESLVIGEDPSTLNLSLDWLHGQQQLAVSLSNGHLVLFDTQLKETVQEWKAHDMEAWIVAADRHDPNWLYSGADDCLMKCWDLRQSPSSPLSTIRTHTMGVTSIQSHPTLPHLFASGSYDEQLRLWDKRSLKRPLVEFGLGGGIWRIKWHPQDPNRMAVACMYNGFHTVRMDQESRIELECSFMEHQSLAYGIDWLLTNGQPERMVTCSFYDHAMHLWMPIGS